MRIVTQDRKHKLAAACVALTLGAATANSHATCTQKDMAGTWYVGGLATVPLNANHDDVSFTTYCKLVVNSAGTFDQSASTCQSSLGPSAISGKMVLSKACQVKAFPMGVFAGGVQIATYTVDYLKVDKSKGNFVGTGNKDAATTNQAQFIWVGSKQ